MSEDQLKPSIDSSARTLRDVNAIKEFKSKLIDGSDNQIGLVQVLDMLIKGYGAMIKSITDFMALSFDTEDKRKEAREVLLRGKLRFTEAELRGVRARCSYIKEIYNHFLDGWFKEKKLENNQLEELRALFLVKLGIDDDFVREVVGVSDALRTASEDIYPLFKDGDFKQAKRKVEEFSQRVEPSLQNMSDQWKELESLVDDFRENIK